MKDSVKTFLIIALMLFSAIFVATILKYENTVDTLSFTLSNEIQNSIETEERLTFLIDSLIVFFYITINNFHYAQEMVHSITNVIFEVVQHDRQRHNIINIKLLSFIILFHIQKQVIFCRQLPMAFDMVHQLFKSMFADKVIFDAA